MLRPRNFLKKTSNDYILFTTAKGILINPNNDRAFTTIKIQFLQADF